MVTLWSSEIMQARFLWVSPASGENACSTKGILNSLIKSKKARNKQRLIRQEQLSRLKTKPTKWHFAPSEDSDQPGHPPSLIRVFAVCMKKAWVLISQWAQSEYSDQTGQMPRLICLRWAHSHFVGSVHAKQVKLTSQYWLTVPLKSLLHLCFMSYISGHYLKQYPFHHNIKSNKCVPVFNGKQLDIIRAASSEFVSSSIPSWQILTAHAQPFRGARDLAFCLKVTLDSLLVWASREGSGETARMRRGRLNLRCSHRR